MVLVHVHVHAAHLYVHVHVRMFVYICTYIHTYIYTYCIYIHTHIHTYIHTYIYTHVLTYVGVCVCVCVGVCGGVCVRVRVYECRNTGLSGIWSVRYLNDKLTMPGLLPYLIKPRHSGIFLVQYRTEIMDARMPIPPLVSSKPMPSYAYNQ